MPKMVWYSLNPGFRNAEKGDFTIGTHSPVFGIGNDGLSLGDLRWVDESYVAVDHRDLTPETFEIVQNYPNPFNGSTTIQYKINNPGMINIQIFDIRGRKLMDEMRNHNNPGNYAFHWSADQLPTGVYYCKIISNGQYKSKAMLYLK
jgi:hypothetical protein